MTQSTGYYVVETRAKKPFGNRFAQAQARARFLANEYGRGVDICFQAPCGSFELVRTVMPHAGAV